MMFNIVHLERIIELFPRHFIGELHKEICNELNEKLANKVLANVGLCIALDEIQSIGCSVLHPMRKPAYTKVNFSFLVFRPKLSEVMEGIVRYCCPEGVYVTIGFYEDILIPKTRLPHPSRYDPAESVWVWEYSIKNGYNKHNLYIEVNEPIYFKVVEESFEPLAPIVTSSDNSGGISPLDVMPSYRIVGAIDERGLGVMRWWNKRLKEPQDLKLQSIGNVMELFVEQTICHRILYKQLKGQIEDVVECESIPDDSEEDKATRKPLIKPKPDNSEKDEANKKPHIKPRSDDKKRRLDKATEINQIESRSVDNKVDEATKINQIESISVDNKVDEATEIHCEAATMTEHTTLTNQTNSRGRRQSKKSNTPKNRNLNAKPKVRETEVKDIVQENKAKKESANVNQQEEYNHKRLRHRQTRSSTAECPLNQQYARCNGESENLLIEAETEQQNAEKPTVVIDIVQEKNTQKESASVNTIVTLKYRRYNGLPSIPSSGEHVLKHKYNGCNGDMDDLRIEKETQQRRRNAYKVINIVHENEVRKGSDNVNQMEEYTHKRLRHRQTRYSVDDSSLVAQYAGCNGEMKDSPREENVQEDMLSPRLYPQRERSKRQKQESKEKEEAKKKEETKRSPRNTRSSQSDKKRDKQQ